MLQFLQNKNKIINILLVGYAFCLPLSKAGINFFEILIILFWIFEGKWKEKFSQIKMNLLSLSIISLVLVSLISVSWSDDISYALNYIAKYRHFIIILIVFTSLRKEYIQYILSSFLLGMFLSEIVSYGIFFELITYKNILPTDPSPFMNHTDYSAYLAFTSTIILGRILNNEYDLKSKIIYGCFFITVTGNLFINGGRTGQVIFVFILLMTLLLSVENKLKAIVFSIFSLVGIFFLAYTLSTNFKHRADFAIDDVNNMIKNDDFSGSFGSRVQLWVIGYDKILNNSIKGSGIGNEMNNVELFSKLRNFNEREKQFADHHNSFITLTIQLGILGLIVLLLMWYSLIKLQFITFEYKLLHSLFLITFFLWSMIGNTLHLMSSMVFFALFAALLNKISEFEILNSLKVTKEKIK